MLKAIYFSILFMIIVLYHANAQNNVLDIGPRLQKSIGLYYENGVSINYSDKRLMPDRLYFGLNYYSSRLGSAMNSNAIKQDNFLFSPAYYFRRGHILRPFTRLNAGYFISHVDDIFVGIIPNKSMLLSLDEGVSVETHLPLKVAASLGYNLITSNGINDVPGTIYPVYYQLTLSWNILKHKK